MLKLNISEKKRLNAIIAANRLIRSDDPERRRTFLREVEVLEFCGGIEVKGPASEFVPLLRSHLASLNPPRERLFIGNFLEYEETLSTEDAEFIRRLLETKPAGSNPMPESGNPGTKRNADRTILTEFDLNDMIAEFQKQLKRETGPFAFSFTVPERRFGERFIVERLFLEFAAKRRNRELFVAKPVALIEEDGRNSGYLLERLRGQLGGSVREWLEASDTRDLMLCIWNDDRPDAQMRQIADSFWRNVLECYAELLESRDQRLLVLWGNVRTETPVRIDLDRFCVLESPREFDPDQVERHWRIRLRDSGVDEATLAWCLRDLRNCEGRLLPTFHEMCAILKSINGGSSSHAY